MPTFLSDRTAMNKPEQVELTFEVEAKLLEDVKKVLAPMTVEEALILFFKRCVKDRRLPWMSRQIEIGPLTKSISGIVRFPPNFDEKKFMEDILEEKYGDKQ